MKTRNGFVSNSSSSSFIIDGTKIFDLAKNMLTIIREDWMDWDTDRPTKNRTRKQFSEYFDKLATLNNKLPEDCDGILFPSCNYDTYIVLDNDYQRCIVATCNNHNWSDLHYTSATEEEESLISTIVRKSAFFDLRNGMIVKHPIFVDGYFKCPACDSDKVYEYYPMIDNRNMVICGSCFKIIPMPEINETKK